MTLDPRTLERLKTADSLALQARAAALAGDRKRARELRAQFDPLWDELEAQAAGVVLAKIERPAELQALGANRG